MSQPKNKKFVITAAIIGVIAVGVIGVYFVSAQTTVTMIPTTQEDQEKNDALGVAQRFIVTSPTFAFDGDVNTLDTVYVGPAESFPPQHMIKIAFDSAHGGFGNREGQMLTQVITHHKMDIIVSEGIVISAVTDDVWDELNNQYVLKNPQPKLPSSDETIIPFDEIAAESSSFSVSTKVISVGGADVQVFEFASESDAKTASLTVSKDGTEIGTSIIRWIDTPHFYTNGKLIVLYVGQNPEIVNLLESFLGKQFAGM